jgi:S-(hydroxymethyl)glutathione dehydrogenase/alcohol dehydrogenase
MKAAVLTSFNAPLTIADVGLTPLRYGQVLVRVLASGICGAQLQEIRGEKVRPAAHRVGSATGLPHLLGHEGVGLVEETGPGVTRMARGDKVVMHWRQAAGIDSEFPRYVYEGKEITSGKVTTFSEFSICSENRLTPVPHDTPRELCTLLGCSLSTALGTVERDAAIKFGERVMVVGVGGLGVNLIRAAKLAQASVILATDIHESKRKLARDMGCTFFIHGESKASSACDCIIDTVGSSASVESNYPHLAPSGRYILVGQPKPGESLTLPNARQLFNGEGQTLRATQGGGFRPELDIPRYIALWRTGRLKLDGIITARYPLEKINEALDQVRAGEAGRILIEMNRSQTLLQEGTEQTERKAA